MNTFDFSEAKAEPYVGSVRAMRSFRVRHQAASGAAVLGGLHFEQPVVDGVNVSQCGAIVSDHDATDVPRSGCRCGWYAYDQRRWWNDRLAWEEEVGVWRLPRGSVSAIVNLSGEIILCERGLKAQYMEVVAIACSETEEMPLRKTFPRADFYLNEEEMLEAYPVQSLSRDPEGEPGWKTRMRKVGRTVQEFSFSDLLRRMMIVLLKAALLGLFALLLDFGFRLMPEGLTRALPLLGIVLLSPVIGQRGGLLMRSVIWWVALFHAFIPNQEQIVNAAQTLGINYEWVYILFTAMVLTPLILLVYEATTRFSRKRLRPAAGGGLGAASTMVSAPQRGIALGAPHTLGWGASRRSLPVKLKEPSPQGAEHRKEKSDG